MRPLFAALILLTLAAAAPPAVAQTDQTQATRALAHAFLERMYGQNDTRGAYHAFAAPDFIQHNPLMADGLAGHDAYFDSLAKQPSGKTVEWAHVFDMVLVDGDLFAVLHHVFRSPEDQGRVFVDLFRVADGKIVEHWDVIQAIPATMPHGNGMACGQGNDYASARALGDTLNHPTCGAPDPRATRKDSMDVIDAYLKDIRAGDVVSGIRRWYSPSYRQHSPTIPDGVEGAITYLEHEYGKTVKALPSLGPAHVVAEGDYVLFHRLVTYPGQTRPSANVDIFRVTDGKVSEHWDIKQKAPETSANGHGMW